MRSFRSLALSALCIYGVSLCAFAALPAVNIEIKDHLFIPQTITIPANTKVRLIFINKDATPEEIDSFDLNREKVIFGNRSGVIFVGPLPPGSYDFFGEYHPNTAVGTVIVKANEGKSSKAGEKMESGND